MIGRSIHRGLLIAAGVCGFTGVLAGTFGAHGIKGRISADMLAVYETGVQYHLAHAIALLGLAIIAGMLPPPPSARSARLVRMAGWCMVFGVIVFSGSLYALALTGHKWLGMITPFGGAAFMLGWLLIIFAAWRGHIPDASIRNG